MATIDKMYEHFQTTYLVKYKSRVTEINTQLLLHTVAGDEGYCKKVIFASVRDTNSNFQQNPT